MSVTTFEAEPGRFRFWATPGSIRVRTWATPSGANYRHTQDLELVSGLQSVRLELAPACALRFEFRIDGAALPHEDRIFNGLSGRIRPVGHEGRTEALTYWLFQASRPGSYEIDFEGHGSDRFLPIPTRRVEAREGETTEVIVELHRK